jgi:hypothetical protein
MTSSGFELAIHAIEQPQTYVLDCSAAGIDPNIIAVFKTRTVR